MQAQAFKTNGNSHHPSIVKGAIPMNTEISESKSKGKKGVLSAQTAGHTESKKVDDEQVEDAKYQQKTEDLIKRANVWRADILALCKPEHYCYSARLKAMPLCELLVVYLEFCKSGRRIDNSQYVQAENWREKMIAANEDSQSKEWLRALNFCEVIDEHRLDEHRNLLFDAARFFGDSDSESLYKAAEQWRDEAVFQIRESSITNKAKAKRNALNAEWLEGKSGDELLRLRMIWMETERLIAEREPKKTNRP